MKLPTWSSGASRPPRWFRIISATIAGVSAVRLFYAQELADVFWGVVVCALMLLNAIAPKGQYDGRFNAWTQRHPIVSGGLTFLVLGGGLVFLLSDYVAGWLAAVIVLPLSAAFVAWMSYRERRRHARDVMWPAR
jgi:TRAP-type C4-dicarboxylate transport system permease large subunit